jgi:pyruvate dehydrogenase E1 component alpha subunit
MFDPDLYRSKEEVERWKERDPITLAADRLAAEGAIDDAALSALWDAARAETEAAVAFAEAGTWEPVSTLEEHVYRRVVTQ